MSAEKDAQRDLDRKKELIAKESIPQATYDRSQAMFDQARGGEAVGAGAGGDLPPADRRLDAPFADRRRGRREAHRRRPAPRRRHRRVRRRPDLAAQTALPRSGDDSSPRVHIGQNVKATVDPYPGDVFAGKVAVVGGVDRSGDAFVHSRDRVPESRRKVAAGMFARVEMNAYGNLGRVCAWQMTQTAARNHMHKLAELCVRRPVFATVIVLSLVVVGWFAYQQLGVDRFPKVDIPTITITTRLVGAAPEEIETDITDKVEEAVNTISGIDQLQSISSEGTSQVIVSFVLEKDIDVAAQEVRDKVNTILRDLPKDADPPIIQKIDPDAVPVLGIALSGPAPIRDITEFADKKLRRRLESINGVGQVLIVGGRPRQINVVVDSAKLSAVGLTTAQVVAALQIAERADPGRQSRAGSARPHAAHVRPRAVAGGLRQHPALDVERLRRQSRRRRAHRRQRGRAGIDRHRQRQAGRRHEHPQAVGHEHGRGHRAAQGTTRPGAHRSAEGLDDAGRPRSVRLHRRRGRRRERASDSRLALRRAHRLVLPLVAEVARSADHARLHAGDLHAALRREGRRRACAAAYTFRFWRSSSCSRSSVGWPRRNNCRSPSASAARAVAFAIAAFVPKGGVVPINPLRLAGALVAFGMLLYFFRRSRPTIIAAIAIPSSIIATFAAMRYENFTLNVITLLALTLAVGIVIDDAVVVLENIFRFMEEKKMSPDEAAVEGTKEVGMAVLATSLSLIAVFLPVAFMAGIVGRSCTRSA